MKIHNAFFPIFLLIQSLCAADPKELSLAWSELEPALARGKVRIALPAGPRIEGRVTDIGPQALRIKITRTSDKRVQPKGETVIPRTALSVVQVLRYGFRWRILGTTIGPTLVATAGTMLVIREGNVYDIPKYMGFGGAAVIGSGVGGYYLGKRADRRVTTIRIVQQKQDVHED